MPFGCEVRPFADKIFRTGVNIPLKLDSELFGTVDLDIGQFASLISPAKPSYKTFLGLLFLRGH